MQPKRLWCRGYKSTVCNGTAYRVITDCHKRLNYPLFRGVKPRNIAKRDTVKKYGKFDLTSNFPFMPRQHETLLSFVPPYGGWLSITL